MTRKIRIRRGVERNLPLLDAGEFAIALDTDKVFYGNGRNNVQLITSTQLGAILDIDEGDVGDLASLRELNERISRIQSYANEQEFSANARQTVYNLTPAANPSSGWVEVFVNGLRIPRHAFRLNTPTELELLVDPLEIRSSTKVIVRWSEDFVPTVTGHADSHRAGAVDELKVSDLGGYDSLNQRITSATSTGTRNETALNELKASSGEMGNLMSYSHLAEGDDWTTALQTALDENQTVYAPAGEYIIGTIFPNSDNELVGSGNGTIFISKESNMFHIEGNVEEAMPITNNLDYHQTDFTVNDTSSISRGDYLLLKSQRDSLNETDSGEHWTLGGGTSSTHKLPFGEFIPVKNANEGVINLVWQPIFPGYRVDDTQETAPAQDTATVEKVNFVENVKLRDFQARRPAGGTIVRATYARNLIIDNVFFNDIHASQYVAQFVFFIRSLGCEARNCRYESPHDTPTNTYYNKNVYKVASSMYCGFTNCSARGASQTFDFSYFSGDIPTTGGYVDGCKIEGALSTGITTHGGTYMARINGNTVYGGSQGIGCRTRRSIITNNTVIGNRSSSSILNYGIGLYEGHAVDVVIQGNTVANFRNGIGIIDAVDDARHFKYTGAMIRDNTVANCYRHIYFHRHPGRTDTPFMGVTIAGNTFRQEAMTANVQTRFIEINSGVNGVTVDGNLFGGTRERVSSIYGVYAEADSTNIRVINNTFRQVTTALVFRGNLSEGSILEDTAAYDAHGNSYEDCNYKFNIQDGRAKFMDAQHADPPYIVAPNGQRLEIAVDGDGNLITTSEWGR